MRIFDGLKIFCTILTAVFFLGAPVSLAIDYTARGGVQDQGNQSIYNQEERDKADKEVARCTREELNFLNRYDKVLRKHVEAVNEVEANAKAGKYKEARDYRNASVHVESYTKFRKTEEYAKLKKLYKKCGVKPPRTNGFKAFWRID